MPPPAHGWWPRVGEGRRGRKKSLLFLAAILMLLMPDQSLGASVQDRNRRSPSRTFSGRDGVHLNSRVKDHAGKILADCPILSHCTCEKKRKGLDVTCTRVTSYKLKNDCDELRKVERHIKYFKIRDSDIPKLEDNIFMGMKIEHLVIYNSNLKVMGDKSVSSQANTLSHLVLSKNLLEDVPSEAVKGLHMLDHLNLNQNKIKVMEKGAFVGLGKVTRLTLYDNQIHKIHKNAFDGLTRWKLPYEGSERDLLRLNLGKNQLSSIPHDAILQLKYLKILELTENQIGQIKAEDFIGMDNLDQLTINHNKLTHLGAGFFKGLNSLTTLYIDANNIKTINKDAFEGLEDSLTSLTLTGNQIEEFPSLALRRIHRLETLHLDNNKIERLDEDAFEGFGEHIKFLWMQNNLIKEIPVPAFQDLHSLQWIKLYNNDLRTLHYELVEPALDTLLHIDLHSNPLVCDCELRWYRQYIEEEWNEVDAQWLKDTFCEDVADNRQHNIAEVPLKDMYCGSGVVDKPSSKVSDDGGGTSSLHSSYYVTYHFVLALMAAALGGRL
jgi:Leucine-rich repeat (LRR) protein